MDNYPYTVPMPEDSDWTAQFLTPVKVADKPVDHPIVVDVGPFQPGPDPAETLSHDLIGLFVATHEFLSGNLSPVDYRKCLDAFTRVVIQLKADHPQLDWDHVWQLFNSGNKPL